MLGLFAQTISSALKEICSIHPVAYIIFAGLMFSFVIGDRKNNEKGGGKNV